MRGSTWRFSAIYTSLMWRAPVTTTSPISNWFPDDPQVAKVDRRSERQAEALGALMARTLIIGLALFVAAGGVAADDTSGGSGHTRGGECACAGRARWRHWARDQEAGRRR